jgi:hypothetical protein
VRGASCFEDPDLAVTIVAHRQNWPLLRQENGSFWAILHSQSHLALKFFRYIRQGNFSAPITVVWNPEHLGG